VTGSGMRDSCLYRIAKLDLGSKRGDCGPKLASLKAKFSRHSPRNLVPCNRLNVTADCNAEDRARETLIAFNGGHAQNSTQRDWETDQ
jgi:hypothetical protein